MRIQIGYFALLRERAKKHEELVDTKANTAGELYEEVQMRYKFPIPLSSIRIAINDRFAQQESALKSGDFVVFIPPIAGG